MAKKTSWSAPNDFAAALIHWYDCAARDLPWRRTRDLYAIWVSEIMLQQTQVATVIPYWERFLVRFPDVRSLAMADEHDVLKLWEGLGYYRRARQLHAAAKQIVASHDGQFPEAFEHVYALPGIGRYTAGAILSIGLDQRLPILEANTIRLLSRLSAYRGDVKTAAGQKHLWSLAEAMLPAHSCGRFNQALMELGSQVCTPKDPQCTACPLARWCLARERNLVAKIPATASVKNFEDVTEVAVVIRRGPAVLLRQCQSGERWAGLWDFPRFKIDRSASDSSASQNSTTKPKRSELTELIAANTRTLTGLEIRPGSLLTTLRHGVTRFRITLHCYEARLASRETSKSRSPSSPSRWLQIAELAEYPLSTTGRKISRLLASTSA